MYSTRPKTGRVQARVLPEEEKALQALAQVELLNLGEALRLAIREAAQERGLWPPQEQARAA